MILGLGVGFVADRVQIHKLLLIINTIFVGGGCLLLYDMHTFQGSKITNRYYIGFIIGQAMFPLENNLAMAILSKKVSS